MGNMDYSGVAYIGPRRSRKQCIIVIRNMNKKLFT